jgi:hypothetical protein
MAITGGIRVDGDIQALEQGQGRKISFAGVRVQLTPIEGLGFNMPGSSAKEDGSFTIENVAPDKYRVMAYNLPAGMWVKSVRVGDQEVLENGADLSGGSAGPMQITLGTQTGQITGTVQNGQQQPAPGSMVTLMPDPIREGRTDLYRTVTTDQSGQFSLQRVPPGDYKLFAWEHIELGRYMDPDFLKVHEGKAVKVTVKGNEQQQVSASLIPAEAAQQ